MLLMVSMCFTVFLLLGMHNKFSIKLSELGRSFRLFSANGSIRPINGSIQEVDPDCGGCILGWQQLSV